MALTTKHAVILTSAAVAVAVGLFIWIYPSHRLAPERHLPSPKRIPMAAQQVLHQRMLRHSEDMKGLMEAVVLLDFPKVKALSQSLSSDANLARPLTGDATELNALLPDGFFTLQDELKSRAARLSSAADRGDSAVMAEAFGQLGQTCLTCHLLYALDPVTGQRRAP